MVTSIARMATLLLLAAAAAAAAAAEVLAVTRNEEGQRCDLWCLRRHPIPMRLRKHGRRLVLTDSPQDVFPSRLITRTMEDAFRVAALNNHVVLIHDDSSGMRNILQGVLESLSVPFILVDVRNPSVVEVCTLCQQVLVRTTWRLYSV